MGLFTRKKKDQMTLSGSQGAPEGTFQCDICHLVQPLVCLCGSVVHGTGDGLSNGVYHICGACALWLGFGEVRFPQGLCFNFSAEQAVKIASLHRELELLDHPPLPGEPIPTLPNALELAKIRMSVTPEHIQSLTDRLSHGAFVDTAEIQKANKG